MDIGIKHPTAYVPEYTQMFVTDRERKDIIAYRKREKAYRQIFKEQEATRIAQQRHIRGTEKYIRYNAGTER